jgi:hypothetical protein
MKEPKLDATAPTSISAEKFCFLLIMTFKRNEKKIGQLV